MSTSTRTTQRRAGTPPPRRLGSLVATVLATTALGAGSEGCLDRPIEPLDSRLTSTLVDRFTQSKVDQIDLLLAIDDSASMADKQEILARAVPDLVDSLANPSCVDANGGFVQKPTGPLAVCPDGSFREFDPVLDIHVGVISTSLGLRGAKPVGLTCADDDGRLVTRALGGGSVATYDDQGFLAWDPAQALSPPGTADMATLHADLESLVQGVGENGCGFEAQLESWYRFLVDPEPYGSIERATVGNKTVTVLADTDDALLAERQAFLRKDSLVAVLLLTDENDCSFRAEGQGFFTAEGGPLYNLKARAVCAEHPDDACCAVCGYAAPGCPEDPTCAEPAPADHKAVGLNCYNQKQRFGADYLYPIDRYVRGLTSLTVPSRTGELVDNPLFVRTEGGVRYERPRDRVFLAGIVGVPWQDIARRGAGGAPDLAAGLMDARELRDNGVWPLILGNPANGTLPTDPHMVETFVPRAGTNPATGSATAPATATNAWADPIAGHEWNASLYPGYSLQYACIFDLPATDWLTPGPDCQNASWQTPLCQAPDGSYDDTQRRAKAFPGLRELAVLEGISDQAIVGSICPAEVENTSAVDYGYRPAIGALTARLKEQLKDPCLERSFTPNAAGQVSCLILEGRATGGACDCSGPARSTVRPENQGAVTAALEDPASRALGLDCLCTIDQLAGEALEVCQNAPGDGQNLQTSGGQSVDGWCYIDATTVPPTGNPELVAHCQATEERTIRFAGAGRAANESVLFLTCAQSSD
ncbi:MAG: hypothetical protein HY908_32850 [Myxococcales bacterium]|nr:hypothetical protein [Myxococcales bacterium]